MDQLREALTAEPFEPFTICLADGQRYRVPHREFVWIPPNQRRVAHVALVDRVGQQRIAVDLVTSLNYVDEGNSS